MSMAGPRRSILSRDLHHLHQLNAGLALYQTLFGLTTLVLSELETGDDDANECQDSGHGEEDYVLGGLAIRLGCRAVRNAAMCREVRQSSSRWCEGSLEGRGDRRVHTHYGRVHSKRRRLECSVQRECTR